MWGTPPYIGFRQSSFCNFRSFPPVHVDRRDQSNVGQMGSTLERVVEHDDVAWLHRRRVYRGLNGHRHGSQMHRHVIAHSDDLTFAVEHGAGIVAALLDVGRESRPAQSGSHFFGYRVVEIFEDLEFDGIAVHDAQCT
jgi:hypothetical protein